MNKYLRLMRFDKPIGIYLLLWPTYWALFLAAKGIPDIKLLIIFTLGVIIMRSAGCVINDYADREFDKHVKRTKNRPIANGEISPKKALILFFILLSIALFLVLLTNKQTIQWAFIACLLAIIYPFSKRYISMPQFILGIAFAMSTIMAFSAQKVYTNDVYWIFLASIIWTLIYDSIYAMADKEEDLKIGIKSSAILFGNYSVVIIVSLQVILLLLLLKIGALFALNIYYYACLLIVLMLMVYHQILINKNNKQSYMLAFFTNHYIGMAVFIGIFIAVVFNG